MESRLHTGGPQSEPVERLAPTWQPHPLAERIPLPTEAEYLQIRDDIAENGQHLPIVRYEGLILDGRTRYRACRELGIAPLMRDFDPDLEGSPLLFAISMNLARRSLSEDQKLVVRQEAVADLRGEGMTNEAIAKVLGVSEPTVRRDQQRRRLVRIGKDQTAGTKSHEADKDSKTSSVKSDKSSKGPGQSANPGANRHRDDSESAGQEAAGLGVITSKRGDKRPAVYKSKATTSKAQPRPIRPRTSNPSTPPLEPAEADETGEPETRIGRVTKLIVETKLKMEFLMAEPPDRWITTAEHDRFTAEFMPFMTKMGEHRHQLLKDYEKGR